MSELDEPKITVEASIKPKRTVNKTIGAANELLGNIVIWTLLAAVLYVAYQNAGAVMFGALCGCGGYWFGKL